MICKRCKNVMRDDDLFCGKCGLSRNDLFYAIKEFVFFNYKIVFSVFALIIIGIITISIIGRNKTKSNEGTIINRVEAKVREEISKGNFDNDLKEKILNAKTVSEYPIDTLAENMDSVVYGRYIQKNLAENENDNGENGSVNKDGIEWLVLKKDEENHRALLFSKYILDMHGFSASHEEVSWEMSEIRKWLNDEFYNTAFSDLERKSIVEAELKNDYDYGDGFRKDDVTYDKVFLLSAKELVEYFSAEKESEYVIYFGKNATAKETEYSKNSKFGYPDIMPNRSKTYGSKDEDEEEKEIKYEWAIGNNSYWLRDPIPKEYVAASVIYAYGKLGFGYYSPELSAGLRPAIWVVF